MKRHTPALAILAGLAMTAGVAWGADPYSTREPLQGITVHPMSLPNATSDRPLGDCTPPTSLAYCADVNREIRENFTPRQIGMLFGASTSYPEYFTVDDLLLTKYANFLRDIGVENFSTPLVLHIHGRTRVVRQ